MKSLLQIVACCFVFLQLSCQKNRDNPLDTGGNNYIPPSVTFTQGIQNGDTLTSNSITFSWQGNQSTNRYRYSLDGYLLADPTGSILGWSPWTNVSTVSLSYLDDKTYTFSVQTMYEGGTDVKTIQRSFTVRAYQNPMIKLYPLRTVCTSLDNISLDVNLQNITDFFATSFSLSFDKTKLSLSSVSGGTVLTGSGYQSAILPDYSQSSVIADANAKGTMSVTVGILPLTGSQTGGINGSGNLLKLGFKILNTASGTAGLSIQNVFMKNSQSATITVNASPSAIVVVAK